MITSPACETFLPISMESIIECYPDIEAVLVCDHRESGLALLDKPKTDLVSDHDKVKLLDQNDLRCGAPMTFAQPMHGSDRILSRLLALIWLCQGWQKASFNGGRL